MYSNYVFVYFELVHVVDNISDDVDDDGDSNNW